MSKPMMEPAESLNSAGANVGLVPMRNTSRLRRSAGTCFASSGTAAGLISDQPSGLPLSSLVTQPVSPKNKVAVSVAAANAMGLFISEYVT